MKIDVVMPKMGESLQEGTITKWLKQKGDKIERDEMILEISTDKVDTEVPAPNSGILANILVEEGETVEVGVKIAEIETDEAATNNNGSSAPTQESSPETTQEEVVTSTQVETTTEEASAEVGGDLVEVVMPKMGESLQEGTITKWLKSAGDKVERDEMILEISTDKVDTEVPSPVSGTLAEIIAEEGETIEVGNVIARISQGGGAKPVSKPAQKEAPKSTSAPVTTAQSTPAAKSETQTVSLSVNGGTKEIPSRHGNKFFSPLVRNIAMDKGVTLEELEQISGSGIDGRVTKKDILEYIDKKDSGQITVQTSAPADAPTARTSSPAPQTSVAAAPKSSPVNYPVSTDDAEIIPMDRVRKLIAEHMVYSTHTSPHVTTVAEADMTEIVNYRNKHKQSFQDQEGFKLTFTPFFVKAAVEGLRKFPMVNVSVDGSNIIKHKKINIGVATALPDGNLIVPVIKKSEELNLTGLARAVNDLATRARNKKLQPDEIQGGTFSITNFGTFGNLFGTPIINQPQTAILGIGGIQKRAVVKEVAGQDMILIRHMAYISLTFDHRVIDGMLGGQALNAIIESLHNMNENTLSI